MRVLSLIVFSRPASGMQVPQTKVAKGRLVRAEAICDDLLGLNRLISQQLCEQLQGRVGIPSSLNDDV